MQAFTLSNGIEFHHLIPLLDLVAVSIASDIVPIMGENRILAYHGLRRLNTNPSIGLKAIIDVCGLSDREITISDIIFKIGPRINASGRIQNGKEAVDLLTEKDFSPPCKGLPDQPVQRDAQGPRQTDDRRGQPHCGRTGGAGRPPLHRALQRGLAQGRHRHRGLAPDGNLLPPGRGADPHQRHGHRLGPLRVGLRRVQGHRILPRPARELRRAHLCRRPVDEGGERARLSRTVRGIRTWRSTSCRNRPAP